MLASAERVIFVFSFPLWFFTGSYVSLVSQRYTRHRSFFVLSVHVVIVSLLLLPVVEGGDAVRFEWLVLFVFHYSGCHDTVLSFLEISQCHPFLVSFTVTVLCLRRDSLIPLIIPLSVLTF